MKKLIPIAFIAVFGALTLTTSCKKSSTNGSYTCSCTFKGSSTGADTTEKVTYGNGTTTQSQAQSACNTLQTDYQLIDPAAKCSL